MTPLSYIKYGLVALLVVALAGGGFYVEKLRATDAAQKLQNAQDTAQIAELKRQYQVDAQALQTVQGQAQGLRKALASTQSALTEALQSDPIAKAWGEQSVPDSILRVLNGVPDSTQK